VNQTIAQAKALRQTIERRAVPTIARDRVLVAHVPGDHMRGHVDASIAGSAARIPAGKSAEYRRGWFAGLLDRYCVESVGAQA
jgi:hypothetical protein